MAQNDDAGNKYGCFISIFCIIGLVIFNASHPNMSNLERMAFSAAIVTLSIVIFYIVSILSPNDDNENSCEDDDATDTGIKLHLSINETGDNGTAVQSKPKETTEKDNDSSAKIMIEESLYKKLYDEMGLLKDFCKKLSHDEELTNAVVSAANTGGGVLERSEENMSTVYFYTAMKDIFRCMKSMGYPVDSLATEHYDSRSMTINLKKKEGQTLYALLRLADYRYTEYSDYKTAMAQSQAGKTSFETDKVQKDLYDYYTNKTGVSSDEVKDYNLSLLLRSVSMDKESNEFKKILYGISRCFSNADGKLSQKEKSFLKELGREAGVVDCEITSAEAPDASIETLNQLIGLQEVKTSITSLVNFITINQKREKMGLKVPAISYHCIFTGNPGTGKTTVARILAGIYKSLGILQTGQLVETDRSGLVAEYVGQTAVKTNKIIDSAIGGVLFIDEAYSLAAGGGEDYGKEAIATLLKRMEDDRDKLVVILAGYGNEMNDFINTNPGLRSRFSRFIHFPDYSADELYSIFLLNMRKFDYRLTPKADTCLREILRRKVETKAKDFGNAREVRNLFEKVVEAQSDRLQSTEKITKETLSEITEEDLLRADKASDKTL